MTVKHPRRTTNTRESIDDDTRNDVYVIGNPGLTPRSRTTDRVALDEAAAERVHRLAPKSDVGGQFVDGHRRTDHQGRHSLIGTIAHVVIANHAATGVYDKTEILSEVKRLLEKSPVTLSTRRAIAVSVVTHVKAYGRFYRAPELQLLGAEVALSPTSRCDLVWRLPNGQILIDEVKTGAPGRLNWTPTQQQRRYLDIARVTYDKDFYGLRVCWLRAPALSATLDASGRRLITGPRYRAALDPEDVSP